MKPAMRRRVVAEQLRTPLGAIICWRCRCQPLCSGNAILRSLLGGIHLGMAEPLTIVALEVPKISTRTGFQYFKHILYFQYVIYLRC
jgi:hypothetical protein